MNAADLGTKAVLVINCGSSSVKFALIDIASEAPLMTGLVECVNSPEALLTWKVSDEKFAKALPDATLVESLSEVIAVLPADAEVIAVGHRVVHGGEEG